eukprot:2995051-Prymnesium_polylepis.2
MHAFSRSPARRATRRTPTAPRAAPVLVRHLSPIREGTSTHSAPHSHAEGHRTALLPIGRTHAP